jgi:dTDP-4-dehydrorhamnose 3,5-epimerase
MIFHETELDGVVIVVLEPVSDERGTFARTFDASEWSERGLSPTVQQSSVSSNRARGTLRGLHFQEEPHAESKLVRCSRGAIYDVAVDLRRDSPTFCRWVGVELTEENGRMLHIAEGLAHGFLTLTDAADVVYQISNAYVSEAARGVRWDDPVFGIEWPSSPVVISERDRTFPDFAR